MMLNYGIFIVFSFLVIDCVNKQYKIQFSGDSASHPFAQRDEMWHPHLKKTWLDNDKFIIEDKNKNIPANLELLQLNSRKSAFLIKNEDSQSPKLECGCKFIKDVKNYKSRNSDLNLNNIENTDNVSLAKINESLNKTETDPTFDKDLSFLQVKEKPILSSMKKNQYRKFYDKKYLINQEQQKPFPMKNIMDLGNSFGQINTNLDYKSILNYLNKNEMLIENLKRMLSNNPNLNNKNSVGYSNINYYRGQDTINDFSPLLLSNKNQSINSINQISNHPFSNVKEKSEISLPNDFFQQFIKAGVN